MRVDPNAELVRHHRYLMVFVDDGAAYQVDSADELMMDLFPEYDLEDSDASRQLRGRLAAHLARNFELRRAYNRSNGQYNGPELRVYSDQDPAASEDDHTVILDTSTPHRLLEGLAATAIVQWIDLDKVFSNGEQATAAGGETDVAAAALNHLTGVNSAVAAETAAEGGEGGGDSPGEIGEYSQNGPWAIRNPRGRAKRGLERVEHWLAGHPQLAEIRYELIFDGGDLRGFARDWVELCELLMPGYLAAGEEERARRRLRYSVDQQVSLQAQILAGLSPEQRASCTPEELRILRSGRAEPLRIEVWQAPAPLVLVSWHYQPYSDLPRPRSEPRDGAQEGTNLWWIDVDDEEQLVRSLADIGVVDLGRFSIKRRQRRQGRATSG